MSNRFYVTDAEVRNFLSNTEIPEAEQYVMVWRAFNLIAQRNGTPNRFAQNVTVFRTAYRNVIGIERERVIWATYLDRTNRQLCDRCGGVGGASHWPGYTCYKCTGKGWTPKQES